MALTELLPDSNYGLPVWQFQGQASSTLLIVLVLTSSTLLIVLVLIFNLTFSKLDYMGTAVGSIRPLVLAVFSLLAVWPGLPVWQFQGQASRSSTLLIVLVLIFNLTFSKV